MYIEEDKILHIRGIDAYISNSIAVTTHRNVNIDFKGKLRRICDIFLGLSAIDFQNLRRKLQTLEILT